MYVIRKFTRFVTDKIIMTTDNKRNKRKVLMCNDLALCQTFWLLLSSCSERT